MQGATLEAELEKEFYNIGKSVKEKKEEVIFCLREFPYSSEYGRGDFTPPNVSEFLYYEAGILNGCAQKLNSPEIKSLNFPPHLRFGEVQDKGHTVYGQYSIPVDRRIEGFLSYLNRFHFEIKDLENIKEGNILISLEDFKLKNIFLNRRGFQSFNLLIGDKEVEDFLKQRKIGNYQELFDILKSQYGITKRIEKHYFDERQKLEKKLVILVNEIANSFREVKSLESGVMNSYFIREREQGENLAYWDKGDLVNKYFSLKSIISRNTKILLEKYLENGEKTPYLKESIIDGENIGLPVRITFGNYSTWLKNKLIPEINKTFEKIDNYLKKEEQKADK